MSPRTIAWISMLAWFSLSNEKLFRALATLEAPEWPMLQLSPNAMTKSLPAVKKVVILNTTASLKIPGAAFHHYVVVKKFLSGINCYVTKINRCSLWKNCSVCVEWNLGGVLVKQPSHQKTDKKLTYEMWDTERVHLANSAKYLQVQISF